MFAARTTVKILTHGGCNIFITRGLKAVKIINRKALPKYKRDLNDLPPLTKYLTIGEARDVDQEQALTLKDLWEKKLATYKSYLPMTHSTKPILLEAMFNPSNDIDNLLRIIQDNLETMTSFYVANAFEVLDDQIQYNDQYRHVIIVAPEFRSLCGKALFKMRFFEADEILKIVKCLATLQLPEETLIVQSTLQMVRHLINDFDYNELVTLRLSLESFRISNNSKKNLLVTLKEAIPLAMDRQAKYKLISE